MSAPTLVLASTSPRRRELMAEAGLEFEVAIPSAVESWRGSPEQTAVGNALAKAQSVAEAKPAAVVVGADTVVTVGGHMLGKPRDAGDARSMLERLSGSRHGVTTGVAVVAGGVDETGHETTLITFRRLKNDEIEAYLFSGEWEGKAGAYAIQETAGGFVWAIEGSRTNVVGLPMPLLLSMLRKRGVGAGVWTGAD